MGDKVDYTTRPSEDFAGLTIEFETSDGERVLGEATTSWSYVGPGLRLSAELLGPEYSMRWTSLDSGLKGLSGLCGSAAVLNSAAENWW